MTKRALVTGGQRGIGLGIARALKDAGYALAIASVAAEDSDEVSAALDALGGSARYYRHDVRDIDRVDALLDRIEADLGPVTTLVSNAGVPAKVRGDMLEIAPDSYDLVLDVNLKGAFFLAQKVARRMVTQPRDPYRSILFVTSASAELVTIERAEYCVSKAGASMMAKLFAARLASEDIGVFELRPGIIATDMTAVVHDAYTARIDDGLVPARRWGTPEDIGDVVTPLVGGQMRFATGAIIPIDGGLSIHRL